MKQFAAAVALAGVLTMTAGAQSKDLFLDLNQPNRTFTLTAAACSTPKVTVWVLANSKPFTNLVENNVTNWGGWISYATNWNTASWTVRIRSTFVYSNRVEFQTLPSQTCTSGVFLAQVILTNGTGQVLEWGRGKLTLTGSPGTDPTILAKEGILDIQLEDLKTASTDTSLVLKPNGSGGVAFGAGSGAAAYTNRFTGSGTTGAVTSAAGDAGKFLKANGSFDTPAGDNLGNHRATQALDLDIYEVEMKGAGSGTAMLGARADLAGWAYPAFRTNGGAAVGMDVFSGTDGQALVYDAATRWWHPGTISGSGDNLGDHKATQDVDLDIYSIGALGAGSGRAYFGAKANADGWARPAFRTNDGLAVGLDVFGAADGDFLAFDTASGFWKPVAVSPGGSDNLGNHHATQDIDLDIYSVGALGAGSGRAYFGAKANADGWARPAFRTNDGVAVGVDFFQADDGDVLAYDSMAGFWKPATLAGGGLQSIGTWDWAVSYNLGAVVSHYGQTYILTNLTGYMMGNAPHQYPAFWQPVSGMSWRGVWDTMASYADRDVVTYYGTTYVMTNRGAYMGNPPSMDLPPWGVVAGGGGLVWRGAWDTMASYANGDVVLNSGSTWVLTNSAAYMGSAPSTSPDPWGVLAGVGGGSGSMTYKGQWDNMASSYSVQDVVSYAGAFYMLTNASGYMMGNVPVGYPAYWAKLGMTYQGPWDTYVNSYGMGDLVEYGGDIYMMTNAALYMSGTWSDAHWKKMTGSSGGGGSAGDSLLGMDITSYSWDNGSNVTIRAGSVMDSMGYGNPGTVLIQGATNKGMNVSSMRHGDITAITVGADHDGIGMGGNGGDITVRTGVGGTMGGTNGALRCIAGYAQTANGDRLGRFVFGSTDESVNQGGMASDGKTFKVGVGGAFITCGQGEGPSYEGWLRIERGASDTVLTFTNSTILVDGFEVYSGPVTATATMMFHKGFCIGVGEP